MPPIHEWQAVAALDSHRAALNFAAIAGNSACNLQVTLESNYSNGKWQPSTFVHTFWVSSVQTGHFQP